MQETEIIKTYKDRIRILLLIYYFSDDYYDPDNPHLKKILTSEVRIQKLDFLLRNPDYLAFELLNFAEKGTHHKHEIKKIVRQIFDDKEPVLRRLDMEKFFFGAYEDIDDVIAFLKSIEFIEFSSSKNLHLKTTEKKYFITEKAITNLENKLPKLPALNWYIERIALLKNYFGNMTGSELKAMQYKIEEYESASWGDYISDIQAKVESAFFNQFGENL
jgi:hypothetical protein